MNSRTSSPGARRVRFRATHDAEARVLLLIDGFSRTRSGRPRTLEGRVKLAKLDFLLRYPNYLRRVLAVHAPEADLDVVESDEAPLEARMIRYRYGPWDPSYYAILGSLIGRGLVETHPLSGRRGFGYRTSAIGNELASELAGDGAFESMTKRVELLRNHLDKSGSTLKDYLYELPEISDASWHEDLS